MKFLIIDPYYPAFLNTFYSQHPRVKDLPYLRQQQRIYDELIFTADFYSGALAKLGHPAWDIILNNQHLQQKWLEEHTDIFLSTFEKIQDFLVGRLPLISGKIAQNWELKVLERQINYFKPDIIYSHNIGYLDPDFLASVKPKVKLIVGQIACPLPWWRNFAPYDLIITSFPHFVPMFKRKGIKSEYLPLCFEPRVLQSMSNQRRIYGVTFIGGISRAHTQGFKLLNDLADRIKIDVWGYGKEELDPKSNLYKYHHGETWGKDMYRLMLQSKITINRHIDVAKNFANNMRLYEATGCGAMLLTDRKDNLEQLFKVGKEVVEYTGIDDLVDKVKYYLKNDSARRQTASAGQARTLSDHTYKVRMKQLIGIMSHHL